ncbi:MAG: Uma2 family endonuclease [Bryobacterales bacterium]|nr:Uma2 family endonuclease [Bryobacterales bacterium]
MADDSAIDHHVAVVPAERSPPAPLEGVHYPDSDGRFLPENPLQANAIVNLRLALGEHFRAVDRVVLEGDMFLYYQEGRPDLSVAPDVFVVLDHDLGGRSVYKLWEEGKPPDFSLEVISPSSKSMNSIVKRELYERLGIGEYFLFQPDPSRAEPRLKGYELKGTGYRELKPQETGETAGALLSRRLGVSLRCEGDKLRVRDLASGQDYAWIGENQELLQAEIESRRRQAARADREAARADREAARADREAEAKRRAEARVAELEVLLGREGRHD